MNDCFVADHFDRLQTKKSLHLVITWVWVAYASVILHLGQLCPAGPCKILRLAGWLHGGQTLEPCQPTQEHDCLTILLLPIFISFIHYL